MSRNSVALPLKGISNTPSQAKMPEAYFGYPMYCILQGIQLEVGHDHVYGINTPMPEHETVPLSHKTCLQMKL